MTDDKNIAFSNALVHLLKGVVIREIHAKQWQTILLQQNKIEDYISNIGLILIVNEVDGCAFLKQKDFGGGEEEIPKLIKRHPLRYMDSLLLVILRKQMLDFDSRGGDGQLVISKQEIIDKLRLYLSDTSDEAKQSDSIEKCITRIKDMGFLRKLRDSEENYEVMRIIRSFIDAEWLNQFDKKLSEYRDDVLDSEGGIHGFV